MVHAGIRQQVGPGMSAGFCQRLHLDLGKVIPMMRLLAFCLLAISLHAAAPNFIFILLDDYGWADSACYGSRFHVTPNIDRLAREGMRFTSGYATAPVCSPTRASILTGKYPARLQLTDWLPGRRDIPSQRMLGANTRQELPLEEITIAE